MVKSTGAVLFFILLTASAFAQADLAVRVIEEVYLARDDGSGKPGERVTEFLTTDVPIHCVVVLAEPGTVAVKMTFVAVSVSGIKPETRVVTASYTTTEAQDRVNFTGRPDGKWIVGKYRVDLFVDGKAAGSVAFLIRRPGAPAAVSLNANKSPVPRKQKPAKRKN